AVAALHTTYAGNRAFWSGIESAAVFLDDTNVVSPAPAVWDALIDQIGASALRNVGPSGDGPFKHFDNVKTFDDLYLEQFKYLRDLRGADTMKPEAGGTGGERIIPRTTNADVVALADYWTKQLYTAPSVMGHDGTVTRWSAARADIDLIARKGEPNAVYPKNN